MAEGLVSSALHNLEYAIKGAPNFMFLWRRRVELVCGDLEEITAELKETEAVSKEKIALSDVFQEINTAAFKLNNASVAFAYHTAPTYGWKIGLIKDFIAINRVEVLRSYVSLLRKKLQYARSTIGSSSSSSSELDLITSSYSDIIEEEHLVGIGKKILDLGSLLTDKADPCDSPKAVISICGMGGLGKTTLARSVFVDSEIRSRFEGFAWIDMSNELEKNRDASRARNVWEALMVELCSEDQNKGRKMFEAMRDEEISRALSEKLKSKKCLIVLDDVWDLESWDCLKKVLPEVGIGTRVLVTTRRTKQVLEEIVGNKNVSMFELKPLDVHESLELLKKRIHFDKFVTSCEDEKKMIKLGYEMVAHFEGLPLAIVALGGLLTTRFKFNDWEELSNNLKWRKRKIPGESGLLLVLKLSYDEMPVQLKQCFLHLAHFPEKYEIRAKELCRIWVAEGFVRLSESAENDAYECLLKLVRRCMVHVKKWSSLGRGKVKTFGIHDSVREFCVSEAQSEGFLRIIDVRATRKEEYSALITSSPNHYNRLVVYLNNSIDTELIPEVKKKDDSLMSLMCFNPLPNPYYEKVLKPLFNNFCMLKVLKFENVTRGYVGKLPKEIQKLLLLRFLSLKNSHILHLPSSIGRLRSLETLDLRTNWRLELPTKVSKLVNLRHLYLPHRCSLKGNKSLSLENLGNLQTVVNISTENCNLEDLAKLKNLLKVRLYVHNVLYLEKPFERTRKVSFDKLESLALENCTESTMDLKPFFLSCFQLQKLEIQGKIKKLPQEIIRFDSSLGKIGLKLTRLEDDPMVILGKLKNLTVLSLNYNSFKGLKMICSSRSFPNLKSLSLIGLEELKEWIVEESALKNLNYLHINYCYNLSSIKPDGLRHIETVKEVVIQRMPRAFKTMFEEQGKEPYTTRHVTIIDLLD